MPHPDPPTTTSEEMEDKEALVVELQRLTQKFKKLEEGTDILKQSENDSDGVDGVDVENHSKVRPLCCGYVHSTT